MIALPSFNIYLPKNSIFRELTLCISQLSKITLDYKYNILHQTILNNYDNNWKAKQNKKI